MSMVHRFTSPEWFGVLRRHISAGEEQKNPDELVRRILNLGVGEALLFAPSAVLYRTDWIMPEMLGSDLLQAKVRKRVTWAWRKINRVRVMEMARVLYCKLDGVNHLQWRKSALVPIWIQIIILYSITTLVSVHR